MTKDPPQRQPGYFMHTDVPADKPAPLMTSTDWDRRTSIDAHDAPEPKRHGIKQETAPEIMHRMYGRRKTDIQRMPGESVDDHIRRVTNAFDDPQHYAQEQTDAENDVKADEAFYAEQGDDVGDKETPYAHDAYMARQAADQPVDKFEFARREAGEVKPVAPPRPAKMTTPMKLEYAKQLRDTGHALKAEDYTLLLREHEGLIKVGAHYRNQQGEVIKVENLAINPDDNYSVHVLARLVESPVDPDFLRSGPALLIIRAENNFVRNGKPWTHIWSQVYKAEVWANVPDEYNDTKASPRPNPHADGVDPEHAYDELIGKTLVGARDYAIKNWKMVVRVGAFDDGNYSIPVDEYRGDRISVALDKQSLDGKVTRILGRG